MSDQFSTTRDSARSGGYSSASDNEGGGWSSARSWTSENDYVTPRDLSSRERAGSDGNDSESDWHSSREYSQAAIVNVGHGRIDSPVTMQMPFVPQQGPSSLPVGGTQVYGQKYQQPSHQPSQPPQHYQSQQSYSQQQHYQQGGEYSQASTVYHNNQTQYYEQGYGNGEARRYQQQHQQHYQQQENYQRPPPQPRGHPRGPPPSSVGGYPSTQPPPHSFHHQQQYHHQPPPNQNHGGRGPPQPRRIPSHSNTNAFSHYPRGVAPPQQHQQQSYHSQPQQQQQQHQQQQQPAYGHKTSHDERPKYSPVRTSGNPPSATSSAYSSDYSTPHVNSGASSGNVDAEDIKEIFQSTRHGRASEVLRLLEKGVPVNVKDKFGNTILAVACQNGLKKLAKIALRQGADINSRNYKGNTPLHFCYTYGYGDTLGTYLISKGADPAIRNHSGLVCYDGLGGTGKK
jgi:hypothetical protein